MDTSEKIRPTHITDKCTQSSGMHRPCSNCVALPLSDFAQYIDRWTIPDTQGTFSRQFFFSYSAKNVTNRAHFFIALFSVYSAKTPAEDIPSRLSMRYKSVSNVSTIFWSCLKRVRISLFVTVNVSTSVSIHVLSFLTLPTSRYNRRLRMLSPCSHFCDCCPFVIAWPILGAEAMKMLRWVHRTVFRRVSVPPYKKVCFPVCSVWPTTRSKGYSLVSLSFLLTVF